MLRKNEEKRKIPDSPPPAYQEGTFWRSFRFKDFYFSGASSSSTVWGKNRFHLSPKSSKKCFASPFRHIIRKNRMKKIRFLSDSELAYFSCDQVVIISDGLKLRKSFTADDMTLFI